MNSIYKIFHGDNFWVIPNTGNDKLSYLGLGILHREDGPAIEWSDNTKSWFLNGKRHRKDGPAIEYSRGAKSWYIHGSKHREDGPAKEHADGYIEWFLNNKWIIPNNEMMEKYIRLNPDNISKIYEYPLNIQLLAISLKPNVIFDIKYPHEKLKEYYPQLMALRNSGLI